MALAAAGAWVITVAHPSATRQFTWPWIFFLTIVWLVPLAVGLGDWSRRSSWSRPNPLLGAGLGVLVVATLLSAALSPLANLSLLRIWPTLAGVALFFWLHDWLVDPAANPHARTEFIARGVAGFGALVALVSLIGWRWQSAGTSALVRNEIPFGHSTYTAGFLLLVLPWLICSAVNTRGIRRVGWGVGATAGFGALLATSSRGGVLAAGAVGVIVAGLAVAKAPWTRRTKVLLAGAVAAIIVLAILSNPRLSELVRHGGWGNSSRESNTQRSAMLEAGWRLGVARPWTGWGPGTVPLVYPTVRGQLSGGVDNVLQLHNTPAQLWATLGGPGMLALILLLAATVRRIWQVMRRLDGPFAVTAAASLGGYGMFALTDHQLDLPAMNALLGLNLALLFQGEGPALSVRFTSRWRLVALLGALAILSGPLLLTGRDLLARYEYERSLVAFETGQPDEGIARLAAAIKRAPYDPYYRHQLASRLLAQRAQTDNPAERARLTAEATDQLEQSLAAGCLQEFAHFNLGWLALEAGAPTRAVPHFFATLREAPHRGGAYFGLGLALRDSGHEAAAVRAFALDWINDPVASTAPVWEWPDFAPLRPSVEREAGTLLAELAPTHPTANYVRELWRWWARGNSPPQRGFNAETISFTETLAALARREPVPTTTADYGWGKLLEAWQQSAPVTDATFARLLPRTEADFAATLIRRAARHPAPDWQGFFTAGLENEPALLVNTRPARTGYGVLALHPDGPVLTDLYVMQRNRFVSTFATTLFPPKGWMPARELLERLPAVPATP